MSKIQRYVIIDILRVLLAVLVATSVIFTLVAGVREGVRKGLPPNVVLQALPYMLPEMLRLTIPASLLFAICTVFGRMAASEEITALKSLGINPLRIVMPVLVVAYVLSLVTFWLYDTCAVWSRPGMYRLIVACVDDLAYSAVRKHGVFKLGNVSVTSREVRGRTLIEPHVEVTQSTGSRSTILTAQQAELEAIGSTGLLRIRSFDTHIESPGNASIALPDVFTHELGVRSLEEQSENYRSPAQIRMAFLPRQIQREQDKIALLSQASATEASESTVHELKRRRARLYRLQAEAQRRLANGFAVFAFAVIGVPISIRQRSADNMSVFFTCFVPIALIYYPLLAAGEEIARRGVWPPLSVWLASVVLTMVGAILMHKLIKC